MSKMCYFCYKVAITIVMKMRLFLKLCFGLSCFVAVLNVNWSCTTRPEHVCTVGDQPAIYPDYREITVPANIAPLNFGLDGATAIRVDFKDDDRVVYSCSGDDQVDFPLKKWRKMLKESAGRTLSVEVSAQVDGEWFGYAPFHITVATEEIDPYLAYRLIEPNYGMWNQLGIYQRNLTTFDEKSILHNSLFDGGCVNCHSFHQYSPRKFMFHVRKKDGGTVLVDGENISKIDIRNDKSGRSATYPMWHPSGDYLIFSSNDTKQAFHAWSEQRVEVYDVSSDLLLYDIRNNRVLTDPRFVGDSYLETFPTWSPDGKWLYFCRAETVDSLPGNYKNLKYKLMRVGFDPESGRFSAELDSLRLPGEEEMSVSFPRVSPDGRYLLYTSAQDATFPVWHSEADLKMIDLSTFSSVDISVVNSPSSESYHSWSSNGRWIVFGSRRDDGLYTRPYIAYCAPDGSMRKPFVLPQKDYRHYRSFMKSYNIPEFVQDEILLSPYELADGINSSVVTPKPF